MHDGSIRPGGFALALALATALTPAVPASAGGGPGAPVVPVVRTSPTVVALEVLGTFPDDLTSAIESLLTARLPVRVVRTGRSELPRSAFFAPRGRYRAEGLIDFVGAMPTAADAPIVLGLASVDISMEKPGVGDWGIFGQGELGGRTAVVSCARLSRGAADRQQVRRRVGRIALHEIGHVLGLPHCEERGCVMRDANGGIRTTDHGLGDFGPSCRGELDRRLGTVPSEAVTAGS